MGNKCDLKPNREVKWDAASQYAQSVSCELLETSAKSNVNVERSFKQLASSGVKVVLHKKETDKATAIRLDQQQNRAQTGDGQETKNSSYCCGFL